MLDFSKIDYERINNLLLRIFIYNVILWILYLFICSTFVRDIPNHKIKTNIKEIEDIIKTGDLLLFSNRKPLGNVIKFWASDYFYHSAIAIKHKGRLWLLEADIYDSYDLVNNKVKSGPHIVRADQSYFDCYDKGYMLWCPLKKPLKNKKVFEICKKYKKATFDTNPFVWYCAKWKWDYYKYVSKGNHYFCSELVADFYKECGLIKNEKPTMFTFKDLRNLDIYKKKMYVRLD